MRLITLHCDYIKFKPLKKALKSIDDIKDLAGKDIKEPLVVLTAVEHGDDATTLQQYVSAIQKTATDVKATNIVLYPYAHLSSQLADPTSAQKMLIDAEATLTKAGLKVTRAPFGYYKEFELKCKGHPLSELSKEFRNATQQAQAPKQTVKKPQQTSGKIILDRRNLPPHDHRILGEDLQIFFLSDDVGPGLPLWLPKGEVIRNTLIQFMRTTEESYGYQYVATPHITKGLLYEKTGHLPHYAETMFAPINVDGIDYYLKPMNCPHHHQIFEKLVKSYRDLPYRLAEAGTVYRNELSGVTYGLTRVRALTQNDAHIYCTKAQLQNEMKQVLTLTKEVLNATGMKEFWYRLSLPDFTKNPEKFTGDQKMWAQAAQDIEKVLKASKEKFVIGEGEAAFYGPKIDIQIKNAHGKEESLATIQVDIVVPQRIGLTYVNEKGEKEFPVIIHRAPLGSYERFISFLLEQTKGNLPLWLAPVQIKIISFTDKNNASVEKLQKQLKAQIPGLRVEIDLRNETVQAKIRDAEVMKIPYALVIGDKEEANDTLAVRPHGATKPEFGVKFKDFVKQLTDELESKK